MLSPPQKPLVWVGSSKKDLMALPEEVQDAFGYALYLAQIGEKHPRAKPLKEFAGSSVLEVTDDHAGNTYRAVYTVGFSGRVYVLHVFQKKSKQGVKTPKQELDLIRSRLADAAEIHASQERRR